MAERKFLDLEGLQQYDAAIKEVIADGDSAITTALTNGTTVVAEATHAASADTATTAGSANAVAWSKVTGKPSTYTPASHTHAISDVTDLETTLDAINEEIDGSISGLSISGKVITYTKNDGTTGTITTQDTTTDNKVAQTVTTTDAEYNLLASATANGTSTKTEGARFAAGVTLNPADKSITATTFIGALSGNATTATSATKLGSSTVGGSTQPIYLNAGTPTKVGAVGTAYGGTGATTIAGARTNLGVYSTTEVDEALAGKASSSHNHDSAYDTKGAAATAEVNAKAYADGVKNDLLNGAGAAYDTLKELGDLIDDNKDAIDALEDIASGKANATHTHAIADVSGLQTALDGKASSSHGTHVTYSTTTPVMDGTASVGTADTVARSDHKHPTDTSRASKTEFDTHVTDTTKHITSTERTNWSAAYTHSQAAHAPSNAEKNQNAFSNITVGSTTVAADSTTDTITFVGSNVTITPDATNDKITFTVASGSTSAAGIVKLTNSTSSTSTTTAATPNSVKSAYDLANKANTAAANAQATADGKADASHTHTVANITDLTATAVELNYMDGVTSNVQTQLDGKATTGHTHDAATTSAAGFMTKDMVVKLNSIATGANKTTVDTALSSTSTNPVQNKVVNSAIVTATNAITANTNSINSHHTAISNLQTAVSEIQEITSAEIQALFA